MPNISELRQQWSENSESYRVKEIGSGVHDFIKNCLASPQLFGLKQTPEKTAKLNTFVHDTEAGKMGRPDFVLYVSEDFSIPVEAKCFSRIKEGVGQIQRYQLDSAKRYSKQYGILTDGDEWRFYRASSYTRFMLGDILKNPQDFVTYWTNYIKPENYYREAFNPSGQQSLFEDKVDLNAPENRSLFFEDITHLINNFKVKMKVAGAWILEEGQNIEKIATETTYAYLIQFILYKVLVDNDYSRFKDQYREMLNRIKLAIENDKLYKLIKDDIKDISEYISKTIYKPFAKEQESINRQLLGKLAVSPTIDEIAPWLDIIIFINKYNFANIKNEIFGFIYENYLKELYGSEGKGQYFTDPAVVRFMLDQLGYNEKSLSGGDGKISLIDPSCGAGTFLYSAVDRIVSAFAGNEHRRQSDYVAKLVDRNVFGLDVEEFPLFLAEMGILMRLLPLIVNDNYENPVQHKLKIFKTKDSIAEFLGAGISSSDADSVDLFGHLQRAALDYPSFMREEKDLQEMFESLRACMGHRARFDFVVGNPPYIGYNSCCRQGLEFVKMIKMGDVYGVNLHSVQGSPKKYPPKPSLWAFFVALGLALLKDNGKICYIIPQTILTETDYDVLRHHLATFTTIETIITFSRNLFVERGLKQRKAVATSSLVFVARKSKPHAKHNVTIINYGTPVSTQVNDIWQYLNSNNRIVKLIPQISLANHVDNWNTIKWNDLFALFWEEYQKRSATLALYYSHETASAAFKDTFWFDVGFIIRKQHIQIERRGPSDLPLITEYPDGGYTLSAFSRWCPIDRVELPKASQGLDSLRLPHKIIWQKGHGKKRFYYTDTLVLPNMSDQQFIASNNKSEILYLFAILNNPITALLLKNLFSLDNEKIGMFVVVKRIKKFIRVPNITTANEKIKREVIAQVEAMLNLEKVAMRDIVDFSSVSVRKFDTIRATGDHLALSRDGKNYHCKISDGNSALVARVADELSVGHGIGGEISLSDIKASPAIDYKLQISLKDHIDHLLFALYFGVPVADFSIASIGSIRAACASNEFYKTVFPQNE